MLVNVVRYIHTICICVRFIRYNKIRVLFIYICVRIYTPTWLCSTCVIYKLDLSFVLCSTVASLARVDLSPVYPCRVVFVFFSSSSSKRFMVMQSRVEDRWRFSLIIWHRLIFTVWPIHIWDHVQGRIYKYRDRQYFKWKYLKHILYFVFCI